MSKVNAYENHMALSFGKVKLRVEIDMVKLTPAQEREIAARLKIALDALTIEVMMTGQRNRSEESAQPFHDDVCTCAKCRVLDGAPYHQAAPMTYRA